MPVSRKTLRYVPRPGASYDFTLASFTTDGAWHENGLDLSAIVSEGAVAVVLGVRICDNLPGQAFVLQQNQVNTGNHINLNTQVNGVYLLQCGILNVDADRLVDYYATNTVFVAIDVQVLGWFI